LRVEVMRRTASIVRASDVHHWDRARGDETAPARRSSGAFVGAVIAIGIAVFATLDDVDGNLMWAVVVGAWAVAAVFVAVQRPTEPLWVWPAVVALSGALAIAVPAASVLVPLAAFALVVVLPEGRVTRSVMWLLVVGLAITVGAALVGSDSDARTGAIAAESIVLGVIAVVVYARSCRRAGAVARSRLQWVRWGVVVAAG
jgi:hypothetical protein